MKSKMLKDVNKTTNKKQQNNKTKEPQTSEKMKLGTSLTTASHLIFITFILTLSVFFAVNSAPTPPSTTDTTTKTLFVVNKEDDGIHHDQQQQQQQGPELVDTNTKNTDSTMSGSIPSSFPELNGLDGDVARETLQGQYPSLHVEVLPEDSMVTMDYREDRVRIFVDPSNTVSRTPIIG
jgi:hypothetical protein